MSKILVYVKNMVTDNNLQWHRPKHVTNTFVEFINGEKKLNFEMYDEGQIDCYYSFGRDKWDYTHKEARFVELWQRFLE